jgi:MrfA Zn-binding domain
MVDFPRDESLMVAGLDAWPFASEACPAEWLIMEERLQARLGVQSFRLPPEHKEPSPGVRYANLDIPTVRFPRWHYCYRCGGMEYLPLFGGRQRCAGRPYPGMNCAVRGERSRPFLIPVRIVAVCDQGHIEDFPFLEWVHRNSPPQADCKLRFLAGRSSSMLTGIKVECSCGESKTLAGIFDFDQQSGGALQRIGYLCHASQPWLGRCGAQAQQCGAPLRVIQRGATNAYFPLVVSSIYLPLWAEQAERSIIDAVERPEVWGILTSGLADGKRIDPTRCDTLARMWGLNADHLLAVAQKRLDGLDVQPVRDEQEYRRQEYTALRAPRGGPATELFVELLDSGAIGPELGRFFTRIGLVKKLRETRALAAFTRLLPPDPDNPTARTQQLSLDQRIEWLPAIIVRGEGIFLELRSDAIAGWLAGSSCAERVGRLLTNYNNLRVLRGQTPRLVTPAYMLLHSLAHSLINQLSFDCGYGSASLRERVYCDLNEKAERMHGILIYTASGDAEGTMGGLVRQGEPERLLRTLMAALQKAQWCSSDPVCIEARAQGTDNANLAACHGCLLVSETSCEEGNRLLDRALLVGTPDERRLGFFAGML